MSCLGTRAMYVHVHTYDSDATPCLCLCVCERERESRVLGKSSIIGASHNWIFSSIQHPAGGEERRENQPPDEPLHFHSFSVIRPTMQLTHFSFVFCHFCIYIDFRGGLCSNPEYTHPYFIFQAFRGGQEEINLLFF